MHQIYIRTESNLQDCRPERRSHLRLLAIGNEQSSICIPGTIDFVFIASARVSVIQSNHSCSLPLTKTSLGVILAAKGEHCSMFYAVGCSLVSLPSSVDES